MKKRYATLLLSGLISLSIQSQNCTAGFTYNSAGTQFNFNGTITPTFPPVISWRWTFGDGGIDSIKSPVHTYAKDSTYTVCLTVTLFANSCVDSVCKQIVVNSANCGSSNFTHKVTGNNVGFTDKSLMSNPVTSWTWDFGDGNGSNTQHPVHVYSQPGQSYYACLTSSDGQGCTKSFCDSVRIPVANCIADFTVTVTGDSVVCTDISQITGPNSVPLRTWDFGDGTVIGFGGGATPGHKYAAPGNYMICLTIGNVTVTDCNDSVCKPVTVTVGINEKNAILSNFKLYPNPASSELYVEYSLAASAAVNMGIYNVLGSKVMEIIKDENQAAGRNKVSANTGPLPAGVYWIQLETSDYRSQKMIVISR